MKNNDFPIFTKTLYKLLSIVLLLFLACFNVHAQKILGDCTIYYSVTYKDKDSSLVNALKTVYTHGSKVRTDFSHNPNNFFQSIIIDNNTGIVNILKEIGPNKYRTTLDSSEWRIHNSLYNNVKTIINNEDVSIILGYRCGLALLTLNNGAQYNVYYTLDVNPSNKENAFQFKDIPGFILKYESVEKSAANPIVIKAQSINLMPISDHLFNIPNKGYRIRNDF